MQFHLKSYRFEGLYRDPGLLQERSGVFVILGRAHDDAPWVVLDLGEAASLREHVANHVRCEAWSRLGHRDLACAVFYCDEWDRRSIDEELRGHFDLPGGLPDLCL
ncbi:hypothetical protein [Piscinibacter terrae]|uniref:Uncharacterized protein n=1 Tax=Piscinibacter terrae TaxID=2496871 RepID=A0A3N7K0I2_9BURK|nr:hypothetical protein [Albitalea terrae]RQP24525.1 hypothetical protein DZC73_14670 [Albitalea terrae]